MWLQAPGLTETLEEILTLVLKPLLMALLPKSLDGTFQVTPLMNSVTDLLMVILVTVVLEMEEVPGAAEALDLPEMMAPEGPEGSAALAPAASRSTAGSLMTRPPLSS